VKRQNGAYCLRFGIKAPADSRPHFAVRALTSSGDIIKPRSFAPAVQFPVQSLSADAKNFGGFAFVPLMRCKGVPNHDLLGFLKRRAEWNMYPALVNFALQ
jgi:hypothetical protein